MSLCKDCISGVTHDGEPQGEWKSIGGINTYVATPTGDYAKDKVLLYLADVFGPQFVNAQLLADDFAKNGIRTVAPDYLNGDPIPPDALGQPDFDLMAWLGRHGNEVTRPPINKVLAALAAEGVTKIAATGYCFGGRYVFDLAFENLINVATTSHPSLLQIPADLEKYAQSSRAPLLINSCTIDTQFPPEAQTKADELLGNGKFAPGYKREYFEGLSHGFAVRGDMSNPKEKAGKEDAFKATYEWIAEKL